MNKNEDVFNVDFIAVHRCVNCGALNAEEFNTADAFNPVTPRVCKNCGSEIVYDIVQRGDWDEIHN